MSTFVILHVDHASDQSLLPLKRRNGEDSYEVIVNVDDIAIAFDTIDDSGGWTQIHLKDGLILYCYGSIGDIEDALKPIDAYVE
jgi:hypothetical protein